MFSSNRIIGSILFLSVSASLPGCGGGGGSSTPGVSSTSPADAATAVARDSVVTASFDRDIFATTVDGNSFTLAKNGGSTSGSVSFDGATNIASFTPSSPLYLLTSYTATLTTDITDLNGTPLASSYAWRFTTRDGTWGTPELVETNDTGDATSASMAFEANGNVMAVWIQYDGVYDSVWANRYIVGSGWGTPELIESDISGGAHLPKVVVDASGNALAVWHMSDGIRDNVWSNRFEVGTGWGTPELVETNDAGSAYIRDLEIDPNGNAIAVWSQYNGTWNDSWANRYVPGTGWGVAEIIDIEINDAYVTDLDIDADGNALAVMMTNDVYGQHIKATRYVPGSGWSTPELLETDNAGDAWLPRVSMDSSGHAIAVWHQDDGMHSNIYANRYTVGTGWGARELIETDDAEDATYPGVAVDSEGNALVTWTQNDGVRNNTWVNRYEVGTGWGAQALLETNNLGNASSARVAFDANGNAMAVWRQSDGFRNNIWAKRFLAETGWGAPELIETDDTGSAGSVSVSIGPDGSALALWNQNDGANSNIMANWFK